MKVSEILKVVKDCERLRVILMKDEELRSEDKMKDEELRSEDKMHICDLLWDYRCECEHLIEIDILKGEKI